MSETQSQPTEEYRPQHVLSSDEPPLQQDTQEPQQQDEAPEKSEVEQAEERLKTQQRREAARIGHLTKLRRDAERQAQERDQRIQQLEQRLAQFEPQQNGGLTQTQLEQQFAQAVEERAAQKLAKAEFDKQFDAWDAKGVEEFGENFRQACTTVSNMATPEQRLILRDVAMDTEGGQKAIMELADKPEELERILEMKPHRMALALAKLGAVEAAPPKPPQSSLPPPIRPPSGGRARGEPDPEKGSFADYQRWSSKVAWRR